MKYSAGVTAQVSTSYFSFIDCDSVALTRVTRHVSVLLSFVGLSATVFVVWIYILVNDVSVDYQRSVDMVTFMVDVVLSCFEPVFELQMSSAT